MFCFKWEKIISKDLGLIKIPVAEIGVQDINKKWKFIKLIVDSGAVISLFKRSFGTLLGIELEKGKLIKLIGELHLKIRAAFAENDVRSLEEALNPFQKRGFFSLILSPPSRTSLLMG